MQHSNQLLEKFEEALRGLIRAEIQQAQAAAPPSPTPQRDRIGNINLAVEVTGKARQTIYNLASRRLIPHSRPDGVGLVFSEQALREWMASGQRPMTGDRAQNAARFIVKPLSMKKGGLKR